MATDDLPGAGPLTLVRRDAVVVEVLAQRDDVADDQPGPWDGRPGPDDGTQPVRAGMQRVGLATRAASWESAGFYYGNRLRLRVDAVLGGARRAVARCPRPRLGRAGRPGRRPAHHNVENAVMILTCLFWAQLFAWVLYR